MSTPPLPLDRRVEQLERQLATLTAPLVSQDRLPQGLGKRWAYWGVTSLPYTGTYPGDGSNTFPFKFVDPTYTPTAGARSLTAPVRTSIRRFIGRSTNGQWIPPGELVMVSPLPPPPGTTGKGRWLITPSKTYYEGYLLTDLYPGGTALASVYRQTSPGAWTNLGYPQTVRDSGFLQYGHHGLRAGTWVRYEWETTAWVVTGPACISCDEQSSLQTSIHASVQTSEEQTSEQTSEEPQTSLHVVCCDSVPSTLYLSIDQFEVGGLYSGAGYATPTTDPDFCADGEFVVNDVPSTDTGQWDIVDYPGEGDRTYTLQLSVQCAFDVYDFIGGYVDKDKPFDGGEGKLCHLLLGRNCDGPVGTPVPVEVIAQSCSPFYLEAIVAFCGYSNLLNDPTNVSNPTARAAGTLRIRIHE